MENFGLQATFWKVIKILRNFFNASAQTHALYVDRQAVLT